MNIKDVGEYLDDCPEGDNTIEPKFTGIFCLKSCEGIGSKFNGGNTLYYCDKYERVLCSSSNLIIPRCSNCVEKNGV
jgi:hypothetical protein